ncbi:MULTISPECIES: exonuclease domain-containing protein [unclassified Mesorhizobium]|uniref:exonuclease domain-containing protein n=1 Tax=unclassified Mesorhizobium TaxID=325217 RepID=UPI002414EA74|nr:MULTISPECIES: exonuclease domain-containing protein [unclassified Mesorhizobium]MDG4889991.1 exonuclease domain-containing protein [Mesorhizobium sp. WSM4887]MDG4904133.1 exonuclease domain-containing protein [Mesorhizobium sp. WSM4962]MDG4909160.1 exonuclease domain-containing protein [Mesorhizobium sp. WSM4898]MDG4921784.1 exonuclease domain-containing protein [Mesorhizobium sp. WSM4989]
MAFVFYDTETTGTNWQFDQILQFAAIKTDHDLHIVDEFQLQSRLLPHVVPSPEAMKVNGLKPSHLTDPSLPSHYQMMQSINSRLRGWGRSMFMGFNNLGLDENILRAAFYKTLHRPYLTVMDGNSRTDLLKLARAAHLLAPGALRLNTGDYGAPVFKLGDLARANGYNNLNAHNARADLDATLHVARILMNEAPAVWNDFMRFAQKSAVLQHIHDEQIFGLAEFYKGKAYTWLVTRIGISVRDRNIHYAFDLQFDPAEFAALSDEELVERLATLPRPVKKLKVNGCPVLFAVEDAPAGTEARALDDAELELRVRRLRDDPGLTARLVAARDASLPIYPPSPHVEQQIFDAFTADNDVAVLEQFHAAPWEKRYAILSALQDGRLCFLGEELIYLESPGALSTERRAFHAVRHRNRVLGLEAPCPWLTLPAAIELADSMIALAGPGDLAHLQSHRAHLVGWRDSLASVAA